ncbi:MAG: bifunctional phosphopantothenoylcysteine decarboxylase/phosphopantothenate--cysteine ligase CoaBC [Cyanobacteria bacterium J06641_5]
MLQGKRILVGIGGGIAAYKVCDLVSQLFQAGADVRCVLTESACQFVAPLSFSTLSRHAAYTDAEFWRGDRPRPLHIELGEWAEAIVLAPLTANTLGKLAHGLADNLLTNILLASRCPVLVAPAMNTDMWEQPAVRQNWAQLQQDDRYHVLEPGAGLLACDRVGKGRMAEPSELLWALRSLLYVNGKRDLADKSILISAGSTREFLDPVRFLGNPSTGKMGIALARAALHRGARVILVHGPIAPELLPPPQANLQQVAVTTAAEMQATLLEAMPTADCTLMAAAVADVKPATCAAEKLPKRSLPTALPLVSVPDIVAELSRRKTPGQTLIGFAAQTGDLAAPALEKLQRKNLDAIVANPIDIPEAGFGSDRNQAIWFDRQGGRTDFPTGSKFLLAHRIYDRWQEFLVGV